MEERVPEFVSKISTTGFIQRVSLAVEHDSDHADDVNEQWKWILDTQDLAEADREEVYIKLFFTNKYVEEFNK